MCFGPHHLEQEDMPLRFQKRQILHANLGTGRVVHREGPVILVGYHRHPAMRDLARRAKVVGVGMDDQYGLDVIQSRAHRRQSGLEEGKFAAATDVDDGCPTPSEIRLKLCRGRPKR
jgi:hypothetical protein